MLKGYVTLSGTRHLFPTEQSLTPLYVTSTMPSRILNIPSRDKEVIFCGYQDSDALRTLDSSEGANYRVKLVNSGIDLTKSSLIINKSEHNSIAAIGCVAYGVHDLKTQANFYAFSNQDLKEELRLREPLRYLFYRFPKGTAFIQIDAVLAKWRRWEKNHGVLHAFNALEHKLYGS